MSIPSIVLAIHIHDAELAKLHHHEPILRYSIEGLPQLCSDELFAAPNANNWSSLVSEIQMKELMEECSPSSAQVPHNVSGSRFRDVSSHFELCAILESIGSLARENRDSVAEWPCTAQKCQELLRRWYVKYLPSIMHSNHDTFCLMILWHSTFMDLHANFDVLECACGREGSEVAQKHLAYAQTWVQSVDAKRCLLHAALIQRLFQSMSIGTEPSIHVPMCLYYCGVAWACYIRFGGKCEPSAVAAAADMNFPELQLLGVNEKRLFLDVAGGLQRGRLESSPLFKVIDLLQRISHWKLSHSFASTLLALVEETQDLF